MNSAGVAPKRAATKFSVNRRFRLHVVGVLSSGVALLCGASADAQQGYRWLTLDPPDSVRTEATGITPNGYISGRYNASDGKRHGFVLIDGTYGRIDPPGSTFTNSNGINPRGE